MGHPPLPIIAPLQSLQNLLQMNTTLRILDLGALHIPRGADELLKSVGEALAQNRSIRYFALSGFRCVDGRLRCCCPAQAQPIYPWR